MRDGARLALVVTASAATPPVAVLDDPDAHSQLSVAVVLDRVIGGVVGYVPVLRRR